MANAVTGVIANDSGLLANLTFEELPFSHAEAVVTSEVCDRSNGYVVTDVDVQLTSWICRQLFSTLTVSGCSVVNATGNEAHCPEGRVVVLLGVRDSIDEIECCGVYYV
nr:uncharacterized protein LOC113822455 [Penaeus vannamei]